MKHNNELNDHIKTAFDEIYSDLNKLVYIASHPNVLNGFEVKKIEKKLKQNIKAIEYLTLVK